MISEVQCKSKPPSRRMEHAWAAQQEIKVSEIQLPRASHGEELISLDKRVIE